MKFNEKYHFLMTITAGCWSIFSVVKGNGYEAISFFGVFLYLLLLTDYIQWDKRA